MKRPYIFMWFNFASGYRGPDFSKPLFNSLRGSKNQNSIYFGLSWALSGITLHLYGNSIKEATADNFSFFLVIWPFLGIKRGTFSYNIDHHLDLYCLG